LVRALNALGGHCHTKVTREPNHGADNRQRPLIGWQPRDEALVDLDPIDREAVQYA
jgi:hypothetical protein